MRARISRATTLYPVGPGTRTMMQSCASAAKLRSGGTHSSSRRESQGACRDSATSNRHRRSVTSMWTRPIQRAPVTGPDAKQHRLVQRPPARTATRRSEAYAPRPRSWVFEYREHSRCGLETTASKRCSSDAEGTATPIGSCLVEPEHYPNGPALSPGGASRLYGAFLVKKFNQGDSTLDAVG